MTIGLLRAGCPKMNMHFFWTRLLSFTSTQRDTNKLQIDRYVMNVLIRIFLPTAKDGLPLVKKAKLWS